MMSLHVIIADDEYFIRQRLKKIIPWDKLKLELSGEADDGLKLLDLLKKKPCDILILDIKMPKLTGLEIAEYIYENNLPIHIIILSGYSDFEFARQALKLRVYDYLIKPIDKAALEEALTKCVTEIVSDKQQNLWQNEASLLIKRMDLYNLLTGNSPATKNYTEYKELTDFSYTLLFSVYLTENHDVVIQNILLRLKSLSFTFTHYQEDEFSYTFQIFYNDPQSAEGIRNMLTTVLTVSPQYIFICLGQCFPIDNVWKTAYKHLRSALNMRFFFEGNHLLNADECIERPIVSDLLQQIRNNIFRYLNTGKDEEKFTAYIHELFEDIKSKKSCSYLILIMIEIYMTYHLHYADEEGSPTAVDDYVKSLLRENYSLEALAEEIIHYGLQISTQKNELPSDIHLTQRVIQYIDSHYMDSSLTVTAIARNFSLNPSYMGSIFKKVTNQSVIQYITMVRMERARELLLENRHKIMDIAAMVGYSDVFYYSKRFKKTFGCSPKEYQTKSKG